MAFSGPMSKYEGVDVETYPEKSAFTPFSTNRYNGYECNLTMADETFRWLFGNSTRRTPSQKIVSRLSAWRSTRLSRLSANIVSEPSGISKSCPAYAKGPIDI